MANEKLRRVWGTETREFVSVVTCVYTNHSLKRNQAVARIADLTASQQTI